MFLCALACRSHFLPAASVVSFSPTTISAIQSSPQITITGLGLDVTSIRAVRFEPSSVCSSLTANPSAGTVNGTNIAAVNGSNQTLVIVTQASALPPGSYSVCIDLVANNAFGAYTNIGSGPLFVGMRPTLSFPYSWPLF